MSSCFQAPKQWCWGTRPPLVRLIVICFFFFLIRLTYPVGNAFDVKRKKKRGWPNSKPQTWRSKLSRKKKTGPGSYSSNDPRSSNVLGGREATRAALLPPPPPPSHSENNCLGVKVSIHNDDCTWNGHWNLESAFTLAISRAICSAIFCKYKTRRS